MYKRTELKQWSETQPHPQKVDKVFRVFPATVVGTLLPPRESIPEDYIRANQGPWDALFSALWMGTPHLDKISEILRIRHKGSPLEQLAEAETPPPDFYMKKGVDGEAAFHHLMCCIRSYEPQHEHKEAGCKYLMDLWFEKVVWDGLVFTREGVLTPEELAKED
jgi:hypothetical protein